MGKPGRKKRESEKGTDIRKEGQQRAQSGKQEKKGRKKRERETGITT